MVKERYAYSREDETRMWMYLYRQRKGVQAARQPKGLEIWRMYAHENVENGRSAHSLNTRFRKTMINRLYDANLPCHIMMYLYLHYKIPMDSDIKTALELKFQIQIELKSSKTLKSYKSSRGIVWRARRSPKLGLTVNDNDDCAIMVQENIPVDDVLALQEESVPLAEDPEVPVKKNRRKEPSDAKLQKERERKLKAIEREKNASVNSKCEQYMYCHVPRIVFDTFPDTELNTRMEFRQRSLQEQLICDEQRNDMQIVWYRKCIDVEKTTMT